MQLKNFSIFGINVKSYTMQEVVQRVEECLATSKQTFIVTANTEMIMLGKNDEYFKGILNDAEIVTPDGIGVVWAGKHYGHDVPERVTGFDLSQEILQVATKNQNSIFFFGAGVGVAEKAIENARLKYPNVNFVGCRNGFFSQDDSVQIIDEINATGPDILFVALGAPMQEKWLHENRARLNSKLLIGIGGSFDVMAGVVERAPVFWQNWGLEWLYRLYKQPTRFVRMLAIPKFMCHVLLNKKH